MVLTENSNSIRLACRQILDLAGDGVAVRKRFGAVAGGVALADQENGRADCPAPRTIAMAAMPGSSIFA
jgi:hypothetical protein